MSEEITVQHQPNIETSEGNKRTCALLSLMYVLSSIAPPPPPGEVPKQSFIPGGSAPRPNPLPFYKPFLTEKAPPSYTFH